MIKNYYTITKPGIIYGNAITVIAGFILASRGQIDYTLLLATLAGVSLVIASGCVFNNYIDRDIDARMERTKNRVLVKGLVPLKIALLYASTLGVAGFSILALHTNLVTVEVTFVGFLVYVVLYSMILKRSSTHAALVGSISGATPLVAGYVAVTGAIDVGAVILFLILAFWQMPHSLAIAIYRLSDYKNASIPVLPAVKGIERTKIEMFIYCGLFVVATLSLSMFGYTGLVYFLIMASLGVSWLLLCVQGFFIEPADDRKWARKVFIFSILTLVVFCLAIING